MTLRRVKNLWQLWQNLDMINADYTALKIATISFFLNQSIAYNIIVFTRY